MKEGELRLWRPHDRRDDSDMLVVELEGDLYEVEVTPGGVFSTLLVENGVPRFKTCPVRR